MHSNRPPWSPVWAGVQAGEKRVAWARGGRDEHLRPSDTACGHGGPQQPCSRRVWAARTRRSTTLPDGRSLLTARGMLAAYSMVFWSIPSPSTARRLDAATGMLGAATGVVCRPSPGADQPPPSCTPTSPLREDRHAEGWRSGSLLSEPERRAGLRGAGRHG